MDSGENLSLLMSSMGMIDDCTSNTRKIHMALSEYFLVDSSLPSKVESYIHNYALSCFGATYSSLIDMQITRIHTRGPCLDLMMVDDLFEFFRLP
jgi:hypothetical protein